MHKILVDGDRQVGKSTLIQRLPSVTEFIESTGEKEWYQTLRPNMLDSVIFVIDLSNRASLIYLYQAVPLLTTYNYKYTSLLLIGNKKGYRKVSNLTVKYIIENFLENEFSCVIYREIDLINDPDEEVLNIIHFT